MPPELIIDPNNPDESLFLKKLNGTHTCGQIMPEEGLSADEIECFRKWVLDTIAAHNASTATGGGTQ